MKKYLLLVAIAILSSCANYSKLYKKGNSVATEFNGSIEYQTVFNLIIVPVTINGETYRFLFDTGAPMVISKELQEKLQLKPITSGRVGDSQGNHQNLEYVELPTMQLGGVGFTNSVAITADLKLSPEIGCLNIDGILGANLMRLAFWKIDFENAQLVFSSNKQNLNLPKDSAIILPFLTKATFTPVVNLTLNKKEIKNATFDTGYAGYFSLSSKYLEGSDSVLNTSYGYGSSGLYGSNFDTVFYANSTLQVSSFQQKAIVNYDKGKTKKLLGIEFMSQFVLVMDWELNQMEFYLATAETIDNTTYGFSPKWLDGKLIIGTLHKGSAPEVNGLQIGDEIKSLNHWDFSDPDINTYCEMLISLKSKDVKNITLVLKDGREFSFRKEKF